MTGSAILILVHSDICLQPRSFTPRRTFGLNRAKLASGLEHTVPVAPQSEPNWHRFWLRMARTCERNLLRCCTRFSPAPKMKRVRSHADVHAPPAAFEARAHTQGGTESDDREVAFAVPSISCRACCLQPLPKEPAMSDEPDPEPKA